MNIEQREKWWNDNPPIKRLHRGAGFRLRRWLAGAAAAIQGHYLADVLLILVALGLSLWSGPLLRLWDATAGVWDIGILSVLPLALLVVAAARLVATAVYEQLVESLNPLTLWQQAIGYGCLYLSYFWAVVWVVVALV